MSPAAERRWRITGSISHWSAILAPPFVLFSLVNKLTSVAMHGHGWHLDEKLAGWLFVVFFPIALPLIAGIASSLRQALDAGRRKDCYPQMAASLSEIKTSLEGLRTQSTIHRAVGRSAELLLDELLEWQLAMKNTGH